MRTPPTVVGEHVADHLPAYVNGTLPAAERAIVSAHLRQCTACANDLAVWEVVRTATLHAVSTAPAATSALDGLWPLIDQLAHPSTSQSSPMATRPHRLPSPSASGDAPDQGVARNRRSSRLLGLSAAFATAALVLAALAMSYGAYRLSHADPERVKPASVPALVVASATPPSVVTVEPLFATLLPADQIPAAGVLDFVVNRLALDPGVTAPVSPDVQSCCSGPQITHVLEGELSVRVEGPAQVFRAGVTRDAANGGSAPPGNEVVLHPGDTMIADFALPTTYDNRGSSPVHVVAIGLYAGTLPGPWADGFTFLDGNEELPQDPRPAGPAELRLTRVTLPPDGVVPTPRPGALVLEVGVNGDASIGKRADGSLRNLSEHAETIYVVTVEPAAMSMLGLPS